MIFKYPKHLKNLPHFIGLSIIDLFILVGGLALALIINLDSLKTLLLLFFLIGGFKLISLKFPRGHFSLYFLKRKTLEWKEKYKNLCKGKLI